MPSCRPPSRSASLRSRAAGAQRGHRAGEHAGHHDDAGHEQQHGGIERQLVDARELIGERHPGGRAEHARRAAGPRGRRRPRADSTPPANACKRGRVRRRARRESPAPSDGESDRARSRLATFAQAMTSMSEAAPSSISSDVRVSPTSNSCSGTTTAPHPAFSFGYACSSRRAMVSSSACAAATVGARLRAEPTTWRLWFSRPRALIRRQRQRDPDRRVPSGRRPHHEARRHHADDGVCLIVEE